jgi:hypothetical protein
MKFHFVTRINEVLDLALENVIERAGSVGFEAAAVVPPPSETAH